MTDRQHTQTLPIAEGELCVLGFSLAHKALLFFIPSDKCGKNYTETQQCLTVLATGSMIFGPKFAKCFDTHEPLGTLLTTETSQGTLKGGLGL